MTKSDTRFAEVGGLASAKRSIRDILELPVKFAPLYESAPIRLPTGILLYVVDSSVSSSARDLDRSVSSSA